MSCVVPDSMKITNSAAAAVLVRPHRLARAVLWSKSVRSKGGNIRIMRYGENDVDVNKAMSLESDKNERVHRMEAFHCNDPMQLQVSQAMNPSKPGYPRWKSSNKV